MTITRKKTGEFVVIGSTMTRDLLKFVLWHYGEYIPLGHTVAAAELAALIERHAGKSARDAFALVLLKEAA